MNIQKISEQAETSAVTLEQLQHELVPEFALAQFDTMNQRPSLYWDGFQPKGVAVNLANCVIEIVAYCAKHNIDLEWAIKMSLDYRRSKQGE